MKLDTLQLHLGYQCQNMLTLLSIGLVNLTNDVSC